MNLIGLPNSAGALTTMCRGAVLADEQRGGSQRPWTVTVEGTVVSEGVSPSMDHAQTAAADAPVTMTGSM